MRADRGRKKGKQNYSTLEGFCFYFFLGPAGRAGIERQISYLKERDVMEKEFNLQSKPVIGCGKYEIYNNWYMLVSLFQRIFKTSYG